MIERDDPQDKNLAALYREASQEQPPAGLDARILAAARATASPAVGTRPASGVNRWKLPVVLATLAVMTTTITLLVQDEEAGRLDKPDTTLRKPPPAPAPAASEPAGPTGSAAAPAPKPVEARRKEAMPPQAQDSAPPPAAPPPAVREEASAAKAEAAVPEAARSIGGLSAEKKATQSAPAADALGSAGAPANAAKVQVFKDQPALENAQQPQIQVAPRAALPPASAPVAAPAPAPYIVPAPAAAPARRADSGERDAARTPEQWIAEIRRLLAEGRSAAAEASLSEFRKRYPYYTLPEDLKRP